MDNQKPKMLWNMSTQTDHMIQVKRPDILVKDMDLDHTWLGDIAVPRYGKVEDKELEKVEKYQDLARDLMKI